MSVSPRPIAMGANPWGARLSVAPRMNERNIQVITTSQTKRTSNGLPTGRMLAIPVGGETGGHVEPGLARPMT